MEERHRSTRRRWIRLAAAGLAVASGALLLERKAAAERVEEPAYTVISRHEGFEIREYAPTIVAEVTVEGSSTSATNAGFRILADFIFGNNEARREIAMTAPVGQRSASEKIAMTAPVGQRAEGSSSDRWVISFTMPSKYTMKTLPRPRDPRVRLREAPKARFAATSFSGAPGQASVEQRMDALERAVRAAGLDPTGVPTYARYDPPWTLPFLRRNEILLPLGPVS